MNNNIPLQSAERRTSSSLSVFANAVRVAATSMSVLQAGLSANAAPTYDDIARRIIEHRKEITNGEFVIQNRVSFHVGNLAGTTRDEILTVYLDAPNRLRATSTRHFGEVGPHGERPSKPFESSVSRVPDADLVYSTVEFQPGSVSPPEVFERGAFPTGLLTDPRMVGLGLYDYANLSRFTLDDVLHHGAYDARFVRGTRSVDGHECFELVSVRGHAASPDLQKVVLVDPDRDYNVLRIERLGETIDDVLDVELQEIPGYGWFPKAISLTETRDGKSQLSAETTVAVKRINQGIDDEVFTLLGMGAPVGARVYDHRGGTVKEMRLTDSGLLEPWSPPRDIIDLSKVADQGWSGRRWLILLNALVVAAIGIALIVRALRRAGQS